MNFKALGEALGLDEEEYRELIELFMTSGAADLERLKAAVADSNLDQIVRSAHTIKGAAGNLGLTAIHETAKQLESLAGNPAGELNERLNTLSAQFAEIQAFMQA